MFKKLILLSVIVSGISLTYVSSILQANITDVYAITNCSGTQVVRVSAGKFEVRYVEANLPGCTGAKVMNFNTQNPINTGETLPLDLPEVIRMDEVTNCTGLRLTSLSNGRYYSTHVEANLPGCIHAAYDPNINPDSSRVNISNGPLLDLASTDIAQYRTEKMKEQGIRFVNALRSVRMRRTASMDAKTNAYLIKNDAVLVDGKETGWVKVQGAEVVVTDIQENKITTYTGGKASGYTAGKYLRDPNNSDLVRVEQADQAYWSDIAHVNVEYKVNVRSHPWYTASIVTTLGTDTPLYIISTVDNWSEVRNDEGSIRGYIRSDFLVVDKVQRVDNPNK